MKTSVKVMNILSIIFFVILACYFFVGQSYASAALMAGMAILCVFQQKNQIKVDEQMGKLREQRKQQQIAARANRKARREAKKK